MTNTVAVKRFGDNTEPHKVDGEENWDG